VYRYDPGWLSFQLLVGDLTASMANWLKVGKLIIKEPLKSQSKVAFYICVLIYFAQSVGTWRVAFVYAHKMPLLICSCD